MQQVQKWNKTDRNGDQSIEYTAVICTNLQNFLYNISKKQVKSQPKHLGH